MINDVGQVVHHFLATIPIIYHKFISKKLKYVLLTYFKNNNGNNLYSGALRTVSVSGEKHDRYVNYFSSLCHCPQGKPQKVLGFFVGLGGHCCIEYNKLQDSALA